MSIGFRDIGLDNNLSKEFWRDYTLSKHNSFKFSKRNFILTIFLAVLVSVVFNLFFMRKTSSNSLDRFLINAKYFWLAYIPIALYSSIGLLKHNYQKAVHLERRMQNYDYRVIFQITTRGFNKESIERSVKSILYWAPKYLRNFEIWIVTEDDVDKVFFEKIKKMSSKTGLIKIIYVPSSYRTINNTKYKARALNYALEVRRKTGYVSDKTWIYLLDEESIVGEDTVVGIVDFIENESKKGKLVGQGIIVYTNYWGRNILVNIEDCLRTGDDISRNSFQTLFGRVFLNTHGSHLLYRSDVEDRIGWDFGEVRAEDMVFGLLVVKNYGNAFGWLKGKLYEQSPFTISDFLKQRRRWLWGILDIIHKNNNIGNFEKILLILQLIIWLLSLPSIVVAYINFIKPTQAPHMLLTPIYGFEISILIYLYYLGAKLHFSIINKNNKLYILLILALVPITGALEAFAAWYGLITYYKNSKTGFEIVKK